MPFRHGGRRRYKNIRFVHLAGHGSPRGLGLIGGRMRWPDVADTLASYVEPLDPGRKRVLCVSCCHSRDGFRAMRPRLRDYFSGCYYFSNDSVLFSMAITVWTMFYFRKDLRRPQKAIVDDINGFFGDQVLTFSRFKPSDAA